jgi:hypothetical protein
MENRFEFKGEYKFIGKGRVVDNKANVENEAEFTFTANIEELNSENKENPKLTLSLVPDELSKTTWEVVVRDKVEDKNRLGENNTQSSNRFDFAGEYKFVGKGNVLDNQNNKEFEADFTFTANIEDLNSDNRKNPKLKLSLVPTESQTTWELVVHN